MTKKTAAPLLLSFFSIMVSAHGQTATASTNPGAKRVPGTNLIDLHDDVWMRNLEVPSYKFKGVSDASNFAEAAIKEFETATSQIGPSVDLIYTYQRSGRFLALFSASARRERDTKLDEEWRKLVELSSRRHQMTSDASGAMRFVVENTPDPSATWMKWWDYMTARLNPKLQDDVTDKLRQCINKLHRKSDRDMLTAEFLK